MGQNVKGTPPDYRSASMPKNGMLGVMSQMARQAAPQPQPQPQPALARQLSLARSLCGNQPAM